MQVCRIKADTACVCLKQADPQNHSSPNKMGSCRLFLCMYFTVHRLQSAQLRVFSVGSIRQYELTEHFDINMNKVYTGEIGRLKSFEVQKP